MQKFLDWLKGVLAGWLSTPASRQREEFSRLGAELDYYAEREESAKIGPSASAIVLRELPLNEDYVYGCI